MTALCLVFNFGLLVFLKYYNFFGGTLNGLLMLLPFKLQVPVLPLVLPLGISFYTLQATGYVIDVYRGKYAPDRHFGRVALFLAFFPQIVEGPIGRYDLLAQQLYEGHSFEYERVTKGLQLLLWGLFKKLVIADRANAFVGAVFDHPKEYEGLFILVATLMYTLQIYADFSGCIDIVSGSAELFGVRLSKNFERPFFSRSVGEFWRRWHITLGAWLRDYVFYSVSLSGPFAKLSRFVKAHMNAFLGGLIPSAFALLCVWLGNGFWHGASWKYVMYGLYYYALTMLGMLFEPLFCRFFEKTRLKRDGKLFGVFQTARTFVLVNIGMMLFRAKGFRWFCRMFRQMVSGFSLQPLLDGSLFQIGADWQDMAVLLAGALVLLAVGIWQERGHAIRSEVGRMPLPVRWCAYFALLFAVIIFGAYGEGYGAVDFIYGQF